MPFFKTTKNILVDSGEYFESAWMASETLILPPKKDWDYAREMQIEDVDLWEVVYEDKVGVYASWSPYAEFYMIRYGWKDQSPKIETYYGLGAMDKVIAIAKANGTALPLHQHWVEDEQMWLYHK